mmetsp:Transcript_8741/g.36182  ORF Transcript_8741/g.36182 Transcript_8741/m.36182 type:complete len:117 (+) Transcript_8741:2348-2698(+)
MVKPPLGKMRMKGASFHCWWQRGGSTRRRLLLSVDTTTNGAVRAWEQDASESPRACLLAFPKLNIHRAPQKIDLRSSSEVPQQGDEDTEEEHLKRVQSSLLRARPRCFESGRQRAN